MIFATRLISNLNFVEVVWSIFAMGAVITHLGTVRLYLRSMRVLQEVGHSDGRRWYVVVNSLRREVIRFFVQLLFVMVGVWAMWTPSTEPVRLFPTLAFLLAQLGLFVNAILDARSFKRLRNWSD